MSETPKWIKRAAGQWCSETRTGGDLDIAVANLAALIESEYAASVEGEQKCKCNLPKNDSIHADKYEWGRHHVFVPAEQPVSQPCPVCNSPFAHTHNPETYAAAPARQPVSQEPQVHQMICAKWEAAPGHRDSVPCTCIPVTSQEQRCTECERVRGDLHTPLKQCPVSPSGFCVFPAAPTAEPAPKLCGVSNPGGIPCTKEKSHGHKGDVTHDPGSYGPAPVSPVDDEPEEKAEADLG